MCFFWLMTFGMFGEASDWWYFFQILFYVRVFVQFFCVHVLKLQTGSCFHFFHGADQQLLIFQHNFLYIFILCGTIFVSGEREIWTVDVFFLARFLIEIVGTLTTAKIHNHFSRIFDIIICLGWLNQDWIDCIISSLLSFSLSLLFLSSSLCSARQGFFSLSQKIELFESNLHNKCNCVCFKVSCFEFSKRTLRNCNLYFELKRKRRRQKKECLQKQ